jgi:hypothetical protein
MHDGKIGLVLLLAFLSLAAIGYIRDILRERRINRARRHVYGPGWRP